MRLAIDALGAKHSGAATVLLAIVNAALKDPDVAATTVYCSPRRLREFELPPSSRLSVLDVALGERGPAGRLAWQYVGLPAAVSRDRADVLLLLSGGGRAPRHIPVVSFIQQSLPFCEEALARLSRMGRIRARVVGWNMRAAARRSAAVAVQTPTMARWVCQGFDLDPAQVEVFEPCATLGPPPERSAPGLEGLRTAPSESRFLYVGNDPAYKNLEILPRAMKIVRRRRPKAVLFATLPVGHRLSEAPGIEITGRLSNASLHEAYRLASALVMPSLVETAGLPIVEAMSCGTPVLAADRPYAHDVCLNAARYFDPCDAADLARGLEELAGDPGARKRLSVEGRAVAAAREAARPYERLIEGLKRISLARAASAARESGR
jgi:glycosyltransferase involved in cell wall biosynthesis